MSKRIIYNKCLYIRVGSENRAHDGQVSSVARAVLQIARAMDNSYPVEDNIVEVLAEIKEKLFEQVKR